MTPARKTLATYGIRGHRVRLMDVGDRYLVEWFVDGHARRRGFHHTREGREEAELFATGCAETLRTKPTTPKKSLTTRELFSLFLEVESPSLRHATQVNYRDRWNRWELFFGRDTAADDADYEAMDRYQVALRGLGLAPNQVGEHIKTVKLVYAWGQRRKRVTAPDVQLYRFKMGKDERRDPIPEYRVVDYEKVLRQLDPSSSRQWRAWVALMILGHQGIRTRSALHLRWEDVDFLHQRILWRKEFDKLGRQRWQPMRLPTYAALLTAQHWQERAGYTGPWVLWSENANAKVGAGKQAGVYRQSTLIYHLHEAERRAGVPRLPLRAAHGLRRMVAGEVLAETGDVKLAMDFIGDTDLRVMKRYLLEREDRLEYAVERLDTPKPYPQPYAVDPEVRGGTGIVGTEGVTESHWSDSNRRPQGTEPVPVVAHIRKGDRTADAKPAVIPPAEPASPPETVSDTVPTKPEKRETGTP